MLAPTAAPCLLSLLDSALWGLGNVSRLQEAGDVQGVDVLQTPSHEDRSGWSFQPSSSPLVGHDGVEFLWSHGGASPLPGAVALSIMSTLRGLLLLLSYIPTPACSRPDHFPTKLLVPKFWL